MRKLFRKFAVKQFALDWNYKVIGMNGPRAGAWILPLFIANGLHIALSQEVDWWAAICWPLMAALIVAVYLGFVYFHIWPVRYSECDRSQKLQFGQRNKHEMTAEEIEEWKKIYESAQ